MKIRIDSMTFAEHPALAMSGGAGGTLCVIPSARMYEYSHSAEGVWGQVDTPEVQARRVQDWWDAHPQDGRWVYFKGFGQPMLDCGAIYGEGIKYGPSADQVVQDFERGEIDVTRRADTGRSDLRWLERFFAALDVQPEMVHIDAEWYYSYWEMAANLERKKVLPMLARSKRARARLPETVVPYLETGLHHSRQAIIGFNQFGAVLTGTAIRRVFELSGCSAPIAAFGYWGGSMSLVDVNGWPIAVPTPDGITNCYGAYDDNEPGTAGRGVAVDGRADRLPAHVVTAFSVALTTQNTGDADDVVPVWRAFDPAADLATRIRSAEMVGVRNGILWASPDPADADVTGRTLMELAELLRN